MGNQTVNWQSFIENLNWLLRSDRIRVAWSFINKVEECYPTDPFVDVARAIYLLNCNSTGEEYQSAIDLLLKAASSYDLAPRVIDDNSDPETLNKLAYCQLVLSDAYLLPDEPSWTIKSIGAARWVTEREYRRVSDDHSYSGIAPNILAQAYTNLMDGLLQLGDYDLAEIQSALAGAARNFHLAGDEEQKNMAIQRHVELFEYPPVIGSSDLRDRLVDAVKPLS